MDLQSGSVPVHFILGGEYSWDWPSTPNLWRAIIERGNPSKCFGGRSAVADTNGPGGRCHRSPDDPSSCRLPHSKRNRNHQVLVQHSRERRLGLARRSLTRATNYAVPPRSKLTGTPPRVSGSYSGVTIDSYRTVGASSILPVLVRSASGGSVGIRPRRQGWRAGFIPVRWPPENPKAP